MDTASKDTRPQIVIVVDDDPAVLSALKFSLEIEGFDVRSFENGEAMLNTRELPDQGCLVIDYYLSGINGLDLLELLRARRVALPAILITTPNTAVRERAIRLGVPIIEKPLLSNALLEKVHQVLNLGKSPDRLDRCR